jgi:23S rRNA pseudouridine1911/1915/1917 synthase
MNSETIHTLEFDGPDPVRLDQYLAAALPALSRSYIRRLIDEGLVTVNAESSKSSRVLRGKESIVVTVPPADDIEANPEDIPLDILYEDEHIIVVNKAAGMVVHPAPGHSTGTLVNALLHHCSDLSGIGGALRPGIVHRLDSGTTGVIVMAKNDPAHKGLSEQFQTRKTEKIYKAIVFGRPEPREGEIDIPIGRDRKDRKKISTSTDLGRYAVTRYRAETVWDEFSAIEISLLTGRTHQVRVHMAFIGHPLVGDDVYAGRRWRNVKDLRMQKKARLFGRPALHALRLAFMHPVSSARMQFEAPMPRDMAVLIKMLGEPR